ncbi:MAG: DUF58 domain-containing protein [Burkholderiaceae bacterium]
MFVLPTRAGALYFVVLIAMLLASLNYGLSLGYALTFLLAALGLIGMMHTFRNVSSLVLRAGRHDPVFAGDLADFSLVVINSSKLPRYALRLVVPGMAHLEPVDIEANTEQMVQVALPAERRGWRGIPRAEARDPIPAGPVPGLDMVASEWALSRLPASRKAAAPLPTLAVATGHGVRRAGAEDDVSSLRPWTPSDSSRRIAWTAMARTDSDTLLVKQFEGGEAGELMLDWAGLPLTMDVEARLSRLTRWVLLADSAGCRFALALPGRTLGPDGGPGHVAECLEALATFGAN